MVELLIIIAVIGVLASSVFFVLNPGTQFAKTRDAQRKSDLKQIQNALDIYYNDNNLYPLSSAGNKIMIDSSEIGWGSPWPPYIIKLPKDPSGQDYIYESSDGGSYRLSAKLERCSDYQTTIGVDCLRPYNYSVNSSNLAMLAPIPTPTPIPSPTPTPTLTPTPTPPPAPKRVFISSNTYNGNLGGLDGADVKCQALANTAVLGGTWKAWLSSSVTSAASRLNHSLGPYRLVDGTLIANNWNDLVTNKNGNYLASSITKDQNNNTVSNKYVWTNTNPNGSIDVISLYSFCNNWVSASSTYNGYVGNNSNININWTKGWYSTCNSYRYLYCFEQ